MHTGGDVTGFVTMTQLSIGLQLGGQSYSQIIFLEDQRVYDDFTDSQITGSWIAVSK